jgi:hypothetical protein
LLTNCDIGCQQYARTATPGNRSKYRLFLASRLVRDDHHNQTTMEILNHV